MCGDGAAKMAFRQEDEVVQALPSQASHESLDVSSRIGGAVGNRDPFDAQHLPQPQVQSAAVRSSRIAWPTPPELAEDPVVVM